MMILLIYASRGVNLGPGDIKDILNASRRNNQRLGVTGALSLSNGIFLQCLEGERIAVNALYHRIIQDKRHTQPEILDFEEITRRQFSGWNMGLVSSTMENAELFLKYSPAAEFDPYAMSKAGLREFFDEITRNTRWLG